jgi:Cd2+/Zn2+-exporting ATPase
MGSLRNVQAVLTALCGVFLVLGYALGPAWAYASAAFGSVFALRTAWDSLRERSLDVNFLMILAAAGAVIVGRPADAAALLFLFSLSNTLETYAMAKTRSAIEGLIKLRPDRATLLTDEGDRWVSTHELVIGDRVRVAAFESIPVDGEIESGITSVNQAAMTGESVPVPKSIGEPVLAGTQNLDGMFVMRVTAPAGGTMLDKVVDLVRDAQENKASGERISQWFGQRYTFFVIAVFVVALLIRLGLKQPIHEALYGALVLLVALSPCALVISTPATTLSALAWAGRRGILVRGGQFLERLRDIKVIVMDKTGTLTAGTPHLAEICVCAPVAAGAVCREDEACWHGSGDLSEEAQRMLRAAAAAEQYSSHPLAVAITRAARDNGIEVPEAHEQTDHPGLGIEARLVEGTVRIGQRRFFDHLPTEFATHVEELQSRGMTVAIMEFQGKHAALGLRDAPRPEAPEVVRHLKASGRRVIMLTGDTVPTAKAVAEEVGVEEYHGGLLPADKTQRVAELEDSGFPVMMVGDGINDAPALSRASVGIAMGGLGSDIALNAADIVLMQDRLARVPQVIALGERTSRIITANLVFAAGVILTLTVSSLFFELPLPLAVIGHEGSTVIVILNGLRLLRGSE